MPEDPDARSKAREAVQRSLEFARAGKPEKALELLDGVLAEAVRENRSESITLITGVASVMADVIGDRGRARFYYEQRLPHVCDRSFGLYNFARILLQDGQNDLAKEYALKSYELAVTKDSDSDRELIAAILSRWPELQTSKE